MCYFLGIEAITTSAGQILLTQSNYISNLQHKASMNSANPMLTPMLTTPRLIALGDIEFDNPTLYRLVVGSLHYATITRPKI